jgi:hypothetical protein
MQLVYSALRNSDKHNYRASARYRGYLAACEKHRETIAQIRQYLPDWEPEFYAGNNQFVIARSDSDAAIADYA